MISLFGEIVQYRLTQVDIDAIHAHARVWSGGRWEWTGEMLEVGDVYPAVILREVNDVDATTANLRVFLDGPFDAWVQGAPESAEAHEIGHWAMLGVDLADLGATVPTSTPPAAEPTQETPAKPTQEESEPATPDPEF